MNCILMIYLVLNHTNTFKTSQIQQAPIIFSSPHCKKFDQNIRIKTTDLSKNLHSISQFNDTIYEWDICAELNISSRIKSNENVSFDVPFYLPIKYCQLVPTVEQEFQFKFYDRQSVPSSPKFSSCTHLPPKDYRWPKKYVKLPIPSGESAVYWPNMGLNSTSDLRGFNPYYPHNSYHFEASVYDVRQEGVVDLAAQYIPFGLKIRSMLEIGAGGGSISVIVNRRYDVTVVNTALPEFPYCEYITERGGICILLDSRKVLPFAKFSFDVIHHSLVFHSSTPTEWRNILLDQNRILRPGGYMWISDGLSYAQLKTIKYLLIKQLGYKILYESESERKSTKEKKFGLIPHQVNWHAILIKPNRIKNMIKKCY